MPRRQHHYVPRFYLRRFKSRCRRINLHNIQRGLTIVDASIKHECAKPDYYRSDRIESALAELERRAAVTIMAMCDSEREYDPDTLRQFIAVQLLRTPSYTMRTAMTQAKFQELLSGETVDGESMRENLFDAVEATDLPVFNLQMSDDIAEAMRDLKSIVVETATNTFITSDNPAFKYNQYLQKIQDHGTTGLQQTGIQVFLPLSPRHVLVMYDKNVYDYVKKQSPTEADVEALNGLQVISASNNLYFRDDWQSCAIEKLASKYAQFRQSDPIVLDELSSDQNPQHFLVHSFEQTPNVGLNLSFLRIKRRADRLSLSKRLKKELRAPYRHRVARRGGMTETFSTRVARF
ncbi:MAG: DUF4238 domain-containing protein [Chloroflexota bacterium]|nr:DUF4238 domain-containing protein [Chloroflexota bacterium]